MTVAKPLPVLDPHRWLDKALDALILEACIRAVSSRKVDALLEEPFPHVAALTHQPGDAAVALERSFHPVPALIRPFGPEV
ncbi:MAG: hypothetical protein ACK6AD_00275 [Cyanobacteriota bacterium]|jgi:hypothetical protein